MKVVPHTYESTQCVLMHCVRRRRPTDGQHGPRKPDSGRLLAHLPVRPHVQGRQRGKIGKVVQGPGTQSKLRVLC